jgi:hypothetical protein
VNISQLQLRSEKFDDDDDDDNNKEQYLYTGVMAYENKQP